MHRFLLQIHLPWNLPIIGEDLRIPSYGVMLAIGAVVAVWMGARRAALAKIPKEEVIDVGVFCVLWGVVGARLFYVFEHYDYFFTAAGFWHILAIWEGGLVFYGGLFLTIGYVAYHFWKKHDGGEQLVVFWDLAAPSTAIGVAFTRIGCFLNGCCYGKPTDLPCGVTYPPDSPIFQDVATPGTYMHDHFYIRAYEMGMMGGKAANSFPVHPTQIYESAFMFILAGVLYWYWPRRRGSGEVGGLFMISYGIFRFLVEFLRINPATFSWAPLSISQWMGIPAIVFGLWLYLGSRGWINPHWGALHPLSKDTASK